MAARAKEQDTEWVSTRVTSVEQDATGVTAAGVRARWLVAADGLHSTVRSAVGISAAAGTPRRYGVRWHFSVPAWSEFVEVYWSPWGEAYVTPVEPDLVGVAILSRGRPDLAWFPRLTRQLGDAGHGRARGCGPLRQVVSRRVAGRVLLVGDAAGYEDALTGEGISLAVKQAARGGGRDRRRQPVVLRGRVAPDHPRLPVTHPWAGVDHRDACRPARGRPGGRHVSRRVQARGKHVGALTF